MFSCQIEVNMGQEFQNCNFKWLNESSSNGHNYFIEEIKSQYCVEWLVYMMTKSLVPPVRVSLAMDRSFIVKSVDAWNSLPYTLKLIESNKKFMTALKKHFSSVPN
jgi:hypothetical protein